LGGLARDAEIAYGQVESEMLRKRIEILEKEIERASESGAEFSESDGAMTRGASQKARRLGSCSGGAGVRLWK